MIDLDRSSLRSTAIVLLSCTAACGDTPTGPRNESPVALIVSDAPGSGASSLGSAAALSAGARSLDSMSYVSLSPGSIPGGETATITNLGSGAMIRVALVDGGFDPVGIPAESGDTLELGVRLPRGFLSARAVVPAARRPRVVRTSPAKGRTDVAVNASIVVVFSEPLDTTTLDIASVRLLQGGVPIDGALRTGDGLAVELTPAAPLAPGVSYQLVLADRLADRTGEPLEGTTTFEFATAPVPVAVPIPPVPDGSRWELRAVGLTSRYQAAGAMLNGILYLVGGRSDCCRWELGSSPVATLEAFDPATGRWTTRAPMPTPRYDLAVAVLDGILYAVGGADESGILGAVEAYDPATDSWSSRAPLPVARSGVGVGVVGGTLYAIGGFYSLSGTTEAYDPATDTWSRRADMPTPRFDFGVAAAGGVLYAVNGKTTSPTAAEPFTATVEAYDPLTDTWSARAPTPTPFYKATAYHGGRLYTVGYDDSRVATYVPATNSWQPAAPLPIESGLPEVLDVHDGILYTVIIRYDFYGQFLPHVYALVP